MYDAELRERNPVCSSGYEKAIVAGFVGLWNFEAVSASMDVAGELGLKVLVAGDYIVGEVAVEDFEAAGVVLQTDV